MNLARPDFGRGAKYVPRRRRCARPSTAAAYGAGMRITTVGGLTRPLPVRFKGARRAGIGDFAKIPNGMRMEHRMDLLHRA